MQCGIVWSFNYKWDYLQILSEPDPSHHGTSLIHHHVPRSRQFSENPPKFFWKDGSGRGLASLSSVDAVWSGNGLAGLVFHYRGGHVRSIGQTRGTKTSFHIQEDERVVRLDVGWRHGVLVALEVKAPPPLSPFFFQLFSCDGTSIMGCGLLTRTNSSAHARVGPGFFILRRTTRSMRKALISTYTRWSKMLRWR